MFRKIRKNNLNVRFGLLLFSLIPSFLLICTISLAVSSMQWQRAHSKAETNLSKATVEINTILEQAVNFTSNTISNSYVPSMFEKNYSSLKDSYETYSYLDMFFANYKENDASSGTNIKIFHDNYSLYRSEYFNYIDVLDKKLVKKLKGSKTADVFWTDEGNSFCAYKALNSKSLTFVIQYKIPKSKINKILKTFDTEKNEGYDLLNTITFCDKPQGNITFSKMLFNGSYICLNMPSGLKRHIYTRNMLIFMIAFALISILLIIFSGMFSSRFRKSVSQFIDTIGTDGMTPEPSSSGDELEPVYNKIINLIDQVNSLHTKNTKMAEEKNLIELKYVQSQFNPHLLYNTLSVLKWECIKYDPSLGKVIQSMTEYYRSCISAYDEIVTLSDEIELVRKYISLMEFTHKKCYPLILNIEPELNDFKTIKHLIQPFIENAILHGLQQKDGGYIKLSAQKENGFVVIDIIDNGTGIDQAQLEEIKKETYFSKYKSYGIKNTRERIRLFHGENSTLDIYNRDTGGTIVSIKISV